jgi:hypothetical protein
VVNESYSEHTSNILYIIVYEYSITNTNVKYVCISLTSTVMECVLSVDL